MQTMKFGLLVVGVLAANAALADVKCSNADQTVFYEIQQYFGGAAPPEGVSLTTEKWRIKGQEYVQSLMLQNVESAGLQVTWVETGVKLGEPRRNQSMWAEQDFIRSATVDSKDGELLFFGHLICTKYTWEGPPPP